MKKICAAIATMVLLLSSGAASCADYPVRPIRIIIPYAAGGGTDVMGRAVAAEMTKSMGQQVLVENKPGALGAIGISAVASAAPDGYTILFVPSTFTQMPQTNKKITFNVEKDFEPITIPLSFPIIIFVNPSNPAKTLPELIAFLKSHHGTAYATSGIGSPGHVAFSVLNEYLKAEMIHVPYKGGSESTAAALVGDVPIAVAAPQPGISMAEQGRLKMLGVIGNSRSKLLPQVPALGELGIPIVDNKVWLGFLAPRGTPKEIIAQLHKEIAAAVLTEPVIQKARISATDIETPNTEAEFAELISQEVKMWADLYRRLNL